MLAISLFLNWVIATTCHYRRSNFFSSRPSNFCLQSTVCSHISNARNFHHKERIKCARNPGGIYPNGMYVMWVPYSHVSQIHNCSITQAFIRILITYHKTQRILLITFALVQTHGMLGRQYVSKSVCRCWHCRVSTAWPWRMEADRLPWCRHSCLSLYSR